MRAELHLGDGLEVMRGLPDASVDLLASDPPYNVTALAFDRQPVDWAAWWAQARRITTPAAPIVLFAAQPFTTDLINSNRRMFRYALVWHKTMPTGFLDANARPLRAHEDILVFAHCGVQGSLKTRPTYNPQMEAGPAYRVNRQGQGTPDHYGPVARTSPQYTQRHPRSVLAYRNGTGRGREGHPTQKPLDLMRWIVASYSNPGDLVLDPFAGSGTTLEACAQLGRPYIGVELDPAYHAVAYRRLNPEQPALLAAP